VRVIGAPSGPVGFDTVALEVSRHSHFQCEPTSGPASVPDVVTQRFPGGAHVPPSYAVVRTGRSAGSPGKDVAVS